MAGGKPTVKVIRGDTLKLSVATPWDLTGYTITSLLKDQNGDGTTKGTFSTNVETNPQTGLNGVIRLTLAAATTEDLTPGAADLCFDIKLVAPNSEIKRLPKTWLNVVDRVTP